LLLGRRTYQDFASFWPQVPADDPFGKIMNSMTKYVVSTTLEAVSWNNSCLINKDVIAEIYSLKQLPGRNIRMIGSGELFNSLLQHDMIDEFQLMVCPVVMGIGKRLFIEGNALRSVKLTGTRSYDSGMVVLDYEPVQKS
jgi:dihydrofolate reductase